MDKLAFCLYIGVNLTDRAGGNLWLCKSHGFAVGSLGVLLLLSRVTINDESDVFGFNGGSGLGTGGLRFVYLWQFEIEGLLDGLVLNDLLVVHSTRLRILGHHGALCVTALTHASFVINLCNC